MIRSTQHRFCLYIDRVPVPVRGREGLAALASLYTPIRLKQVDDSIDTSYLSDLKIHLPPIWFSFYKTSQNI